MEAVPRWKDGIHPEKKKKGGKINNFKTVKHFRGKTHFVFNLQDAKYRSEFFLPVHFLID